MKKELREKTDLFIENTKIFKSSFKWEGAPTFLLGSLLYAFKDKKVEAEKIKDCRKIFKENVGFLSDLRLVASDISIKMSLESDPKTYIERLKQVYDKMDNKFFNSMYSLVAAMLICDNYREKDTDRLIEKNDKLFSLMKKRHPFLTGQEDIPLSMMLSFTDKTEEEIMQEVETIYNTLSDEFKRKNELQDLSHVLTLSNRSIDEKTKKVIEIYNILQEKKKKIDKDYNLALIGMLALIDKDSREIVEDVIEVDNYLGTQKGLGLWPYGKTTRMFFASAIVLNVLDEASNNSNAIPSAIVSTTMTRMIYEEIISTFVLLDLVILDD